MPTRSVLRRKRKRRPLVYLFNSGCEVKLLIISFSEEVRQNLIASGQSGANSLLRCCCDRPHTQKVARSHYCIRVNISHESNFNSAAGKILRRELRDRAKEELSGKDPGNAVLKVKL